MSSKSSNRKSLSTRKRKANACTFCGKVIVRIGDHLQQQHAKEKIIQEIRKLDVKEKRKRLAVLISQGNFKHNQKAMNERNGVEKIIPKYKKQNKQPRNLVPCEKCGAFVQENIQRHRCPAETTLTVNLPRTDQIVDKMSKNSHHTSTVSNPMNDGETSKKAQIEDDSITNVVSKESDNSSNVPAKLSRKKASKVKVQKVRDVDLSESETTKPTTEESDSILPNSDSTQVANEVLSTEVATTNVDCSEASLSDPKKSPHIESLKIDTIEFLPDDVINANVVLPDISSMLPRNEKSTVVIKPNTNSHDPLANKLPQNIREKLTAEILDSLRDDEIAEIIRHDKMILTFGEEKLKGVLSHKFNNNYVSEMDHIRQMMRRAGKYLYCFRKVVGNPTLTLEESFKNQYQYHGMLPEIGVLLSDNYSHPFNINNTRTALGNILEVFMSKEFDKETYELWGNTATRFKTSWHVLNKQASRSKRLINEEKKMIFPSDRDYKRLLKHLEKNLKKYTNKKVTTYSEYLQLSRLVLTKVTLFNHRRSGEVARMTIDEFERRDRDPDVREYKTQLTELEIALAKVVDIVTLKGKSAKNELVIAILLPECQTAIKKVLECKNQFPFLRQNKFVFAVRGYRKHHLNGYKTIRKIVSEAKLKNAQVFTAGRIRKNICTKMVYMNLDEVTKKLLISQLGHLSSIHQDIYEEHMRSGLGQFTKLPAELLKYHSKLRGVHDDKKLIENLKMGSDRLENAVSEPDSSTDSESDTDNENESEENAPKEPPRRSSRLKSCTRKNRYVHSSCSEDDEHSEASEYIVSEEDSEDEIWSRAKLRSMKKRACPRKKRKIQIVKWNSTMNGILKEIFLDELQNKDFPIKLKKLRECQSRFTKEAEITVSTSSIKSTLYNIRHGHRRLETDCNALRDYY